MVPALCGQVLSNLVVECCTGEINLEISLLDIVQEKCTGRFDIVGFEGFQQMCYNTLLFAVFVTTSIYFVIRHIFKLGKGLNLFEKLRTVSFVFIRTYSCSKGLLKRDFLHTPIFNGELSN